MFNLKNEKNTYGGVLLLVKLLAFILFFTFFKLYKWYQTAQGITYNEVVMQYSEEYFNQIKL